MRNLILGLMLLGTSYWLFKSESSTRQTTSVAEAHTLAPMAITPVMQASMGVISAPSQRERLLDMPAQMNSMSTGETADQYLERFRSEWNIQQYHEARRTITPTASGALVRYDFFQNGVPITGLSITMELTSNNDVRSVDNQYKPVEQADTQVPVLSAPEIREKIASRFQTNLAGEPTMMLFVSPQNQKAEPAFMLTGNEISTSPEQAGRQVQLMVRATDGAVLDVSYQQMATQPIPSIEVSN